MTNFVEGEGMTLKKNYPVGYNGITDGVIWQQLLLFLPDPVWNIFPAALQHGGCHDRWKVCGKRGTFRGRRYDGNTDQPAGWFFVGMSSGAAVVVSQFYGAKEEQQVRKSVHTAFCLALAGGVMLLIIGEIFTPVAIRAMGAPEEILGYSVTYLRIYFLGIIGNLVYNMGAAILRAVGDSKRPLYFLVASCLTNIALDLLFVVCFHMEVAGAALATIMSQLLSAVLVMITLIRTKESYRFIPKELRVEPVLLKRIIKIGLPAGLQSMMYSISIS